MSTMSYRLPQNPTRNQSSPGPPKAEIPSVADEPPRKKAKQNDGVQEEKKHGDANQTEVFSGSLREKDDVTAGVSVSKDDADDIRVLASILTNAVELTAPSRIPKLIILMKKETNSKRKSLLARIVSGSSEDCRKWFGLDAEASSVVLKWVLHSTSKVLEGAQLTQDLTDIVLMIASVRQVSPFSLDKSIEELKKFRREAKTTPNTPLEVLSHQIDRLAETTGQLDAEKKENKMKRTGSDDAPPATKEKKAKTESTKVSTSKSTTPSSPQIGRKRSLNTALFVPPQPRPFARKCFQGQKCSRGDSCSLSHCPYRENPCTIECLSRRLSHSPTYQPANPLEEADNIAEQLAHYNNPVLFIRQRLFCILCRYLDGDVDKIDNQGEPLLSKYQEEYPDETQQQVNKKLTSSVAQVVQQFVSLLRASTGKSVTSSEKNAGGYSPAESSPRSAASSSPGRTPSPSKSSPQRTSISSSIPSSRSAIVKELMLMVGAFCSSYFSTMQHYDSLEHLYEVATGERYSEEKLKMSVVVFFESLPRLSVKKLHKAVSLPIAGSSTKSSPSPSPRSSSPGGASPPPLSLPTPTSSTASSLSSWSHASMDTRSGPNAALPSKFEAFWKISTSIRMATALHTIRARVSLLIELYCLCPPASHPRKAPPPTAAASGQGNKALSTEPKRSAAQDTAGGNIGKSDRVIHAITQEQLYSAYCSVFKVSALNVKSVGYSSVKSFIEDTLPHVVITPSSPTAKGNKSDLRTEVGASGMKPQSTDSTKASSTATSDTLPTSRGRSQTTPATCTFHVTKEYLHVTHNTLALVNKLSSIPLSQFINIFAKEYGSKLDYQYFGYKHWYPMLAANYRLKIAFWPPIIQENPHVSSLLNLVTGTKKLAKPVRLPWGTHVTLSPRGAIVPATSSTASSNSQVPRPIPLRSPSPSAATKSPAGPASSSLGSPPLLPSPPHGSILRPVPNATKNLPTQVTTPKGVAAIPLPVLPRGGASTSLALGSSSKPPLPKATVPPAVSQATSVPTPKGAASPSSASSSSARALTNDEATAGALKADVSKQNEKKSVTEVTAVKREVAPTVTEKTSSAVLQKTPSTNSGNPSESSAAIEPKVANVQPTNPAIVSSPTQPNRLTPVQESRDDKSHREKDIKNSSPAPRNNSHSSSSTSSQTTTAVSRDPRVRPVKNTTTSSQKGSDLPAITSKSKNKEGPISSPSKAVKAKARPGKVDVEATHPKSANSPPSAGASTATGEHKNLPVSRLPSGRYIPDEKTSKAQQDIAQLLKSVWKMPPAGTSAINDGTSLLSSYRWETGHPIDSAVKPLADANNASRGSPKHASLSAHRDKTTLPAAAALPPPIAVTASFSTAVTDMNSSPTSSLVPGHAEASGRMAKSYSGTTISTVDPRALPRESNRPISTKSSKLFTGGVPPSPSPSPLALSPASPLDSDSLSASASPPPVMSSLSRRMNSSSSSSRAAASSSTSGNASGQQSGKTSTGATSGEDGLSEIEIKMEKAIYNAHKLGTSEQFDRILYLVAKYGANVNYQCKRDGSTALMAVARHGNSMYVAKLKALGASLDLGDKEGRIAAEFALHKKHEDLARELSLGTNKQWKMMKRFINQKQLSDKEKDKQGPEGLS